MFESLFVLSKLLFAFGVVCWLDPSACNAQAKEDRPSAASQSQYGGESIHYKNNFPAPEKETVTVPLPREKPTVIPTTTHFMDAGGPATEPYAYAMYCMYNPDAVACKKRTAITRVALTEERKRVLEEVNAAVNGQVKPRDDSVLYDDTEYPEHWTIPEKSYDGQYYGDCEDYVLWKQQMLIKAGIPRESLAITIVDPNLDEDAHHVVLMVHTRSGDLVLDNLVSDIKYWNETPYTYLKIQWASSTGWVKIQPPATTASVGARP